LLGLPAGAKSQNGFAIPEWIFENMEYVKMLVKGLIETDGTVARVYRHKGWYSHVHFSSSNSVIMGGFLRAVGILGYPFKVSGTNAILADTALTRQRVAELGITKCKEYVYP
jgi:hypothetical protein